MNPTDSRPAPLRPALAVVLHNANMRVAMVALAMVSVSIVVVGLIALRAYMIANLGLSARNIAYTVEAAVIFNDKEAASEALALMAANHLIASAQIIDRDGNEITRWQDPDGDFWSGPEKLIARVFLARPAIEKILHGGEQVGMVKLYGSGRNLLVFMMVCIACGIGCFMLCSLAASRLSRRSSLAILEPLQHLAAVAAQARREREFRHRVQQTDIAELHVLGEDFNALLEELENWREQMLSNNALLSFNANHDPLTCLANRTHFETSLNAALTKASDRRERVALFFIDADHFKSINDEFGHEAGDAVLCAIAHRLRSRVRESDLVARIGGDEFAVLLTPLNDASQAGPIAASILESMAEPIGLPSGAKLTTSLSIGIALYPDHASNGTCLLRKADEAMYESKRTRRGIYSVARDLAPEGEMNG